MVQKRSNLTDQEWLDLFRKCRTSGMTDKDWCETHQINRSNFYYHLRRLKKKACEIPESSFVRKVPVRQEVVPLQIQDTDPIVLPTPARRACTGQYLLSAGTRCPDQPA